MSDLIFLLLTLAAFVALAQLVAWLDGRLSTHDGDPR